MKHIRYFIYLIIILNSCKPIVNKTVAYNINGFIKGKTDSTKVFLKVANQSVDSSYIINGKFHFTGKIEKTQYASLYNSSKNEYAVFWLENRKIKIICKNASLNNSTITGSSSQDLYNSLNNELSNNSKKIDSIQTYAKSTVLNGQQLDKLQEEYDNLESMNNKINRDFIRNNKESIISAFILNQHKGSWEIDTTRNLFNLLSYKKSPYAKDVDIYIKAFNNPQIGDKYIDFELMDNKGGLFKISDIKDKYILIDFWASWCSPCRALNPTIIGEYEKYKNEGLEIVGVSLDKDKDRWKKAIRDDNLKWINLCDFKGNNSEPVLIYKVNNIPNNILINKDGVIIARNLEANDLKSKLKEIFDN